MLFLVLIPQLLTAPTIDAHLEDWRDSAFTDGVWDIERLRHTPWFDHSRNRLTAHTQEPHPTQDLAARYYTAWRGNHLYLGAEVTDNVNDVADPAHEPRRWFYKDSICWFIEAPYTGSGKNFGEGDNAFCFVIDSSKPNYGAWWRHGAPGKTYIEEPLPPGSFEYAIRFTGENANYVLEARVDLSKTFALSSPRWTPPKPGDRYGLMIVHCDPDGGAYGGHLLIYGTGDDDSSWTPVQISGPALALPRRPN